MSKMKWQMVVSFFFGTLMHSPAFALVGHDQGHGAIGIVCYDLHARNAITASYLFDLWEGAGPSPIGRGFDIQRSDEPLDGQISKALAKLSVGNDLFAKQVQVALSQVRRDFFIMRDIGNTNDVDPVLNVNSLPKECIPRQLGVYEDDDINFKVLKIEREVYDTLISPTDHAAFFLHEAIFKVLRQNYALYEYWDNQKQKRTNLGESSRVTRHIVAALFSGRSLESPVLQKPETLLCQGDYFRFLISKDRSLEILQLGVPVFSRTTAQLQGVEVLEGELQSQLQFLEETAKIEIKSTNDPLRYDVRTVGGKFEIPTEKVTCSAPISSFFSGPK